MEEWGKGEGTRRRLSMPPSLPGSRKILIVELSRGYLACSIPGVEVHAGKFFLDLDNCSFFREVDGIACLLDWMRSHSASNRGIIERRTRKFFGYLLSSIRSVEQMRVAITIKTNERTNALFERKLYRRPYFFSFFSFLSFFFIFIIIIIIIIVIRL